MAASKLLNNAKDAKTIRDGSAAPSGFIIKLYQMCNGAPDDVISVSLVSRFSVDGSKPRCDRSDGAFFVEE